LMAGHETVPVNVSASEAEVKEKVSLAGGLIRKMPPLSSPVVPLIGPNVALPKSWTMPWGTSTGMPNFVLIQ
jgi:hypothetical protein